MAIVNDSLIGFGGQIGRTVLSHKAEAIALMASEVKGSILLGIDPFALFVCLSKQSNIWQQGSTPITAIDSNSFIIWDTSAKRVNEFRRKLENTLGFLWSGKQCQRS